MNKIAFVRGPAHVMARRLESQEYFSTRRKWVSSGIAFLSLVLVAVTLAGCSLNQASLTSSPAPSTSASTPADAAKDFNAAQVLQNAGRCDQAIPLYLKAIQENNIYVNAYRSLGDCYHSQGSDNAAIAEYNKAIPLDPTNWFLYYARAGAEVSLGMNGQARADYNNALRLAPPVRDTYQSIAQNGFNSFSDFPDAIAAMNKAIELSPDDPSLYEARGNIFLTAKQYTDAYNDYKKAIAVAPYKASQSSINADLANVYAGQGNYDPAFMYMRTAISLQPSNPHLYVLSGNIHRDAGHFTDAIGLYNQVFKLVQRGPDVESAHEGIGDVYAAMGQIKPAISAYQQAMRFTKDTAGLKAKIKATRQSGQS